MIMEMLRAGEVREDDDSYQSPLDELFDRLEMRSPDHIAVKYYKDYRKAKNAENYAQRNSLKRAGKSLIILTRFSIRLTVRRMKRPCTNS